MRKGDVEAVGGGVHRHQRRRDPGKRAISSHRLRHHSQSSYGPASPRFSVNQMQVGSATHARTAEL
jgi:hypothetical protein